MSFRDRPTLPVDSHFFTFLPASFFFFFFWVGCFLLLGHHFSSFLSFLACFILFISFISCRLFPRPDPPSNTFFLIALSLSLGAPTGLGPWVWGLDGTRLWWIATAPHLTSPSLVLHFFFFYFFFLPHYIYFLQASRTILWRMVLGLCNEWWMWKRMSVHAFGRRSRMHTSADCFRLSCWPLAANLIVF